jgi:hypothetical protein
MQNVHKSSNTDISSSEPFRIDWNNFYNGFIGEINQLYCMVIKWLRKIICRYHENGSWSKHFIVIVMRIIFCCADGKIELLVYTFRTISSEAEARQNHI